MKMIARFTGVLLLVMAICAGFAEMGVRAALVVPGDAATTVANILASPARFRLGLVGYLLAYALDVPVAVFFYLLLASVDRALAMLTMSFRLVYAAIAGAALIAYAAAGLLILSPTALPSSEAQGLAVLALALFDQGFNVALVIFGTHLVLLGSLLYVSGRVPRLLGALVAISGLSYLVGSFSLLLAPTLHAQIAGYLAVPAMFELLLAIWLLLKSVQTRVDAPMPKMAPVHAEPLPGGTR
jgi:hypothetical protein